MGKKTLKKIEEFISILRHIHSQEKGSLELLVKFKKHYKEISYEERVQFFDAFVRCFEIHKEDIEEELRLLLSANEKDPIQWGKYLSRLRGKMESPRIHILRNFINIPGGLKFLLDLRADVIATQGQTSLDLEALERDIAHLFNSWFKQGFLSLQEITQNSPYRQVQFLKDHDLVHPMAKLEEMGGRLGNDRRCFALYHLAMPEEPVVFIEVALTKGIARSIQEIIQNHNEPLHREKLPDTAIFYSINNTQNGLEGLGLGKIIIFQVLDILRKDHPGIKTFSTLSPIPGFWEQYLKRILEGDDSSFTMKRAQLVNFFPREVQNSVIDHYSQVTGRNVSDFFAVFLEILSNPQWIEDKDYTRLIEKPLTEITYFYICKEKDRRGKPRDAVARFHLGNGAIVTMKNINFDANRSSRGLIDSCGIMINYIYSKNWFQQISVAVRSRISLRPKENAVNSKELKNQTN
jgi:hypothetical protein